ncbi:transporter substrate-binding domain-containing protein [Devosia sp.]|uniref:transporter substrate-binding domain-containing protein n=1 Tax=Devosia sp. TaxID=1871048 RepID=UPI003266111D
MNWFRLKSGGRLLLLSVLAVLVGTVMASATTLETVRQRGFLVCGATAALPGFAQQDDKGRWSGFDVDLCRAIAAAVFGNPDQIEFRPLRGESRFAPLQTGAVDVLTRDAPWTQKRDTAFETSYVATAFFDGQAFMVPQSLGAVSAYELDNISICVLDGGDELARLQEFFFANQATYTEELYEDVADLGVAYRAGRCQAVSAPARQLQAIRRDLPEPNANRILPERISKELLGPVVREGDDQWFNIVQWTLFTLINAEEVGLTSLNLDSLSAARTAAIKRILGEDGDYGTPLGLSPKFMSDIIRTVGNYGEIYDRNFGPQTGASLLRGQNALWSNGGLLYAPPVE